MIDCQFCHGLPVGDAATWVDGKPRPAAPCPRCGETNDRIPAIPTSEEIGAEVVDVCQEILRRSTVASRAERAVVTRLYPRSEKVVNLGARRAPITEQVAPAPAEPRTGA